MCACSKTLWTSGQGIGFSVRRIDGKLYVGHGGGYPGYTTNTTIQLDSKVGVIVLTNTNDSNPSQIAEQLMGTVGEAVASATSAEPEPVAWDPAWERFAGVYRSRGGETRVLVMNERLVTMNPWGTSIGDPTQLRTDRRRDVSHGGAHRWWPGRRDRTVRRGERRGCTDDYRRFVLGTRALERRPLSSSMGRTASGTVAGTPVPSARAPYSRASRAHQ